MTTTSPAPAGRAPAQAGTPIAEYALLSDCNSAALVDRAGTVEWLCLPRFDSPAVFARILDPAAGHWRACPTCWGPAPPARASRWRSMRWC